MSAATYDIQALGLLSLTKFANKGKAITGAVKTVAGEAGEQALNSNNAPPTNPGVPRTNTPPTAQPTTTTTTSPPQPASGAANAGASNIAGHNNQQSTQKGNLGTLDPATSNKTDTPAGGGFWSDNKGLLTGLGVGAGVLGLGALSGNKMGMLGSLGTLGLLGGAGYVYDKLGGWDNIKQLGGGGWSQMMDAKSKSEAFAEKNPERWKALQKLPAVKAVGSDAGMLGRARSFLEMNPEQKDALSGDKLWENLQSYEPEQLEWAMGLGDRWQKAPEDLRQVMTDYAQKNNFGGDGGMSITDMVAMAKDKPILALQDDKFNSTLKNLVSKRNVIDHALGFESGDQLQQQIDAKETVENIAAKFRDAADSVGDFREGLLSKIPFLNSNKE